MSDKAEIDKKKEKVHNKGLDDLKVMLTILVVFHHAGQAYGNGGSWPYSPSNQQEHLPWIWHFFSVNAAFFMGLFFFISGYFVPRSYDKQGGKLFVKRKFIRLGTPLFAMGTLLSLACKRIELGHMWYIESLLLFCLLYALVRQVCLPIHHSCQSRPTLIGLTIVGSVMGIGSFFIRQIYPQDYWIWPVDIIPLPLEPAHYLQYVLMFALGILSWRFGWMNKTKPYVGLTSLLLGCGLSIGIYVREEGAWNDFVTQWFGFYESLLCVFLSFGLLWLFNQHLNKASRFLSWCSAQSYGVYIVHLPIIIGIQHAVDEVWMGAWGKFFFVGITAMFISYLLVAGLRCSTIVKRII